MRFRVGSIPECPEFVVDDSWMPLREPTPWMMQLIAVPIGIFVCAIFVLLWAAIGVSPESNPGITILSVIGMIVIHELLHAAVHPGWGLTQQTLIGFWPAKFLFFAHYTGAMSRNRFLLVLVTPLLVLSVAPLIWSTTSNHKPFWLAFVSCLNALSACGDILGIIIVWWQVPRNAIVRNQGYFTYWKFP